MFNDKNIAFKILYTIILHLIEYQKYNESYSSQKYFIYFSIHILLLHLFIYIKHISIQSLRLQIS